MDWIDMVRGRDKWLGTVNAGINLLVDTAKRLTAFERKVSRRMFGGIKVNENWRKRYNKEFNAAVLRFRYTFIHHSKLVGLDWSC